MRRSQTDALALAHYRQLSYWEPAIGDFIVWAGSFRTWYGLVAETGEGRVRVVLEGLPLLLVTLLPEEQDRVSRWLSVGTIKGSARGAFSILQHDKKSNVCIWYT